ncbi:MAG: hypothetical protein GX444_00615 [Myxococcales bacterium]|nr:hypothetical protein [Myxococcales bacterium]
MTDSGTNGSSPSKVARFVAALTPVRVFLLTAGFGILFFIVRIREAIFDDSYITYRYARNIARGLGPIFNPGEKVEGCTTFLQMTVLAPFIALGINPYHVSVVIAHLCLALITALGYRKITRAPQSNYNANWSLFFPLLMATNPAMIHWVLSGMETIWFMAAVVGAVWLAESEMDHDRRPILSALVCVLAALIRPEGTTLAAALALSWLCFVRPLPIRRVVVFALLFAVLYGVYFAWRYSYYGYLYPNTYYAKVDGIRMAILWRGLLYVVPNLLWGVFPLAAILLFRRVRDRALPLLRWEKISLVVVTAFCAQSVFSGGDFMPYFRFLVPIWPLTVLLTWSLLARFDGEFIGRIKFLGRHLRRFATERLSAGTLILYVLVLNVSMMVLGINEFKIIVGMGVVRRMEMDAKVLDGVLPKDALVAAVAIGAMGYILDRPLIDILGLTDEHIAHKRMKTGLGVPGHEKYDTPYLLSRQPDFILNCVEVSKTPLQECPAGKKEKGLPAVVSLENAPQFIKKYAYCSHPVENGYISTYMRRARDGQPEYKGWTCPKK